MINEQAVELLMTLWPKCGEDSWKHVQYRTPGNVKWSDCGISRDFNIYDDYEYRIKPNTHTINGIECPAPITSRPERGAPYYLLDVARAAKATSYFWKHDEIDFYLFKLGIFETEQDALDNFYAHFPHMKEDVE